VAFALTEGADAAGFYVNPDNGGGMTSMLGIPIKTSTAVPTKTIIVGEWSSAQLFVGDGFRVDTSTEANDRWDKNLTGFRGEEEIGFNADPYVASGLFQVCLTAIP
jgi:hypothetical protein